LLRKTVVSAYIIGLLIPVLAGNSTCGQSINTLPWKKIVENFNTDIPFCTAKSEDGQSDSFTLRPDAIIIPLPSYIETTQRPTEIKLNLSKWQQDQWLALPPLAAIIESKGLSIGNNNISEGFYNIALGCVINEKYKENHYYAIITTNWKKDLLSWSRNNKEQIETNPDPQLIYSSIAVSHFDNLMELTAKSPILSQHILSAISKAVQARADFEAGNCPDLVVGLNKIRLKRFEGARIAEFVLLLPESHNTSKKLPMLVDAGARNNPRQVLAENTPEELNNTIMLWWYFPMPFGYEWKDYKLFLDIVGDKINLDKDKIYVNGECRSGISAIDLGLKYPDQWAECSASLGNASRQLAGNALNLPIILVKGPVNDNWALSYYNFASKCFEYYGCKSFKSSKTLSIIELRGSDIPTQTRELHPFRVYYTTESLANSSAYWLKINGREDENFIASIDAIVKGQSILVKTDNVDAYTLNLEHAPLDCNRPVKIIENNNYLDSVTGPVFIKNNKKYENATYIKNNFLHGPISDVFTDRYVVVWKGDENIRELAKQLAGSGPNLADSNLSTDYVTTHNIIYVGRLDKSAHLEQVADKLPVNIEDGRLIARGRVYDGDFGVIYIYPNPLNPQKYLVIFSGSTDKAMKMLNNAWKQIKSKDNADIGIFKILGNDRIEWLISEKFNAIWDWHASWDTPLAKLDNEYPKWKWRQLVARILRKQLNADVMISDNPFNTEEIPGSGILTMRDIARIFKNEWIVKISIMGSDLRELLMVSFKNNSTRDVLSPVIDGVSLVKQSAGSDFICINDLKRNKYYTVALPYQAVNGNKMGMYFKNYRLEDQGFLVLLLYNYLKEYKNISINVELDNIQMNIF